MTSTPFPCTPPSRRRELEFKLEEALRGAEEERERGNSVEAKASELREKMKQAEQSWQRFALFPRGGAASSGRARNDATRVVFQLMA